MHKHWIVGRSRLHTVTFFSISTVIESKRVAVYLAHPSLTRGRASRSPQSRARSRIWLTLVSRAIVLLACSSLSITKRKERDCLQSRNEDKQWNVIMWTIRKQLCIIGHAFSLFQVDCRWFHRKKCGPPWLRGRLSAPFQYEYNSRDLTLDPHNMYVPKPFTLGMHRASTICSIGIRNEPFLPWLYT